MTAESGSQPLLFKSTFIEDHEKHFHLEMKSLENISTEQEKIIPRLTPFHYMDFYGLLPL